MPLSVRSPRLARRPHPSVQYRASRRLPFSGFPQRGSSQRLGLQDPSQLSALDVSTDRPQVLARGDMCSSDTLQSGAAQVRATRSNALMPAPRPVQGWRKPRFGGGNPAIEAGEHARRVDPSRPAFSRSNCSNPWPRRSPSAWSISAARVLVSAGTPEVEVRVTVAASRSSRTSRRILSAVGWPSVPRTRSGRTRRIAPDLERCPKVQHLDPRERSSRHRSKPPAWTGPPRGL